MEDSPTYCFISRAHSPDTATRVHADKVQHKPFQLLPTALASINAYPSRPPVDARTLRQQRRNVLSSARSRKSKAKPRPLSAREKRKYCVHDLPQREARYSIYVGLYRLWCGYMRDLLGISELAAAAGVVANDGSAYVTPQRAGPLVASADFHGAVLEVVRSECVGRVGLKGVVVRDTKFTFVLVTRGDKVKSVPKAGTWFRIKIPVVDDGEDGDAAQISEKETEIPADTEGDTAMGTQRKRPKKLVFELQGSQFENRAPDRATKKFKMRLPKHL